MHSMAHGAKNLNLKLISSRIHFHLSTDAHEKTINSVFYSLPQPLMTNSDLGRLLKAFEIQSVLRAPM